SGARRSSSSAVSLLRSSWVADHSSPVKSKGDGRCAIGMMTPQPGRTSGGSRGSRVEAYRQKAFSMHTSAARNWVRSQKTQFSSVMSEDIPPQAVFFAFEQEACVFQRAT